MSLWLHDGKITGDPFYGVVLKPYDPYRSADGRFHPTKLDAVEANESIRRGGPILVDILGRARAMHVGAIA